MKRKSTAAAVKPPPQTPQFDLFGEPLPAPDDLPALFVAYVHATGAAPFNHLRDMLCRPVSRSIGNQVRAACIRSGLVLLPATVTARARASRGRRCALWASPAWLARQGVAR